MSWGEAVWWIPLHGVVDIYYTESTTKIYHTTLTQYSRGVVDIYLIPVTRL